MAITLRMRDEGSGTMPDPPHGEGATRPGEAADADLMRRTVEGDREAFATLYYRHHNTVYRFARLMTGSTSDAEDIVQEVFLVVMRDARRYDPARAALSTYLYGVARHKIRRRLSRARTLVAFEAGDGGAELIADDDPNARLDRRRELQRLRRAILSLPPRYREVVILCDLQNVSYSDASAAIGCALGTIRSRLHRARHLLVQKMGAAAVREAGPERLTIRCAV